MEPLRPTGAIRHLIRVPEAAIRHLLRAQMVMRLRQPACTTFHLFRAPRITERTLGMEEITTEEAALRMEAIRMPGVTGPTEVPLARAHILDILLTMRVLVRARLKLNKQLRGSERQ